MMDANNETNEEKGGGSSTMDNVVQFPNVGKKGSLNLGTPPQTQEEVQQKIDEYKKQYSEELSELLWNHVMGEMARSGCDFTSRIEELYPSMIFLYEAINSLYLHANDIHHPLQEMALDCLETARENEGEDSGLANLEIFTLYDGDDDDDD